MKRSPGVREERRRGMAAHYSGGAQPITQGDDSTLLRRYIGKEEGEEREGGE